MNEFKGTPGPWDYGWEIQPNGCPTVGHKGLMVCMVAHSAKDPEQKEIALANADLISAAPDMLAALQAVKAFMAEQPAHTDGIDIWVKVNRSIAKALGK